MQAEARKVDNGPQFDFYKKRLTNHQLNEFSGFADKFAEWIDNPRAHYTEARPRITDICMAAYENVLHHLLPAIPLSNTPIDIRVFCERSLWAASYFELSKKLAKYTAFYENDPSDTTARLRFILATVGIGSPSPMPVAFMPDSIRDLAPPTSSIMQTFQPPSATSFASASASASAPRQRIALPKRKKKPEQNTLNKLLELDLQEWEAKRVTTPVVATAAGSSLVKREVRTATDLQHLSATPERFRNASVESQNVGVSSGISVAHQLAAKPNSETADAAMSDVQSNGRISEDRMEVDPVSVATTQDVEMQNALEIDEEDPPAYQPDEIISDEILVSEPRIVALTAEIPPNANVLRRMPSPGISATFAIHLTASQFKAISAWNNRLTQPTLIKNAECTSLCCLRFHDVQKDLNTVTPVWPVDTVIHLKPSHFEEPVFLPFPENGFVDLCPFLQRGDNTIEIISSRLLQDLGWVVFAHKPAKEQLENLALILMTGTTTDNVPVVQPPAEVSAVQPSIPGPIPMRQVHLPQPGEWSATIKIVDLKSLPTIGPHSNTIDFRISPVQFESMQCWKNRYSSINNVESSLCLSFCCYRTVDVRAIGNATNKLHALGSLAPTWPSSKGSLKLTIGEMIDFPLSPPCIVDENGFVDLCACVKPGANTLVINQDRGMVEYTYGVFVHAPSRQQLEAVSLRVKKDHEWTTFLRDLEAKPLQLAPTPCPWLTTSA